MGEVTNGQKNLAKNLDTPLSLSELSKQIGLNDKHNGQIYKLTGPRLLTFKVLKGNICYHGKEHSIYTPIS
ncbi:hypothetical protein [Maribellus maritimus]|uniref:hypothetical protein n=1 Tax=Maribellus maritimus TaxID=2870838 RepID=UPI001EEA5B0A|nr:hypothetical protein [Maribellus maritimus]MCG6186927.1 hypothetical protein [Maribellus maritimus]